MVTARPRIADIKAAWVGNGAYVRVEVVEL